MHKFRAEMKILMVCLGNICRSPLADGLLRDMLQKEGIENVFVDSCGTSNHHEGELPDHRMMKTAKNHGVDISYLRSRPLNVDDLDEFDIIYAMDDSNRKNILKLPNASSNKHKIRIFLNELYPGENLEVPDPYFGGQQGFEHVYNLVKDNCEVIINKIKNNSLA